MTQKVGIAEGFISSFNPKKYEKISRSGLLNGFLYVLCLAVVISIFLSFRVSVILDSTIKSFSSIFENEVREISVEGGILSSPVPQPYIKEVEGFAFVIDTTGELTSLDRFEAGLFLGKDKIMIKGPGAARLEEYNLSQMPNLHITPYTLQDWIKRVSRIAMILIFFGMAVYYWGAKIVHALLFSLFSLAVNSAKKKNMEYGRLLNIGLYAVTPPTILAVLLISTGGMFIFFPLVYAALYAGILKTAVDNVSSGPPQALREEAEK